MISKPFRAFRGDDGLTFSLNGIRDATETIITDSILVTSTFVLNMYRHDGSAVALNASADDKTVKVADRLRIALYATGDTIRIDDEEMTISAINVEKAELTVTRASPEPHLKDRKIFHRVATDPNAVAYDPATRSLDLTLPASFTARVGLFWLEIIVSAPTATYRATRGANQEPVRLMVMEPV